MDETALRVASVEIAKTVRRVKTIGTFGTDEIVEIVNTFVVASTTATILAGAVIAIVAIDVQL